MVVDGVAEFDDALIDPTGVGDDHHQEPRGGQRDHLEVTHRRRRQRGVLHDRHLTSQLSQQPHRATQHIIEIKEIKFRPGTDINDYQVKMRSVMKFLEDGDKVKVTLRFRGRELAHQDLGLELLRRVQADVGDAGKVESMPRLEGKQMVMMIGPK